MIFSYAENLPLLQTQHSTLQTERWGVSLEKFQREFFNILTKELNFFIKDYYSYSTNSTKWAALLDLGENYSAVIVTEEGDSSTYDECLDFLSKSLNKPFVINNIVLTNKYELNFIEANYNKLIFSLESKKILYYGEGTRAYVSIINLIANSKRKNQKLDFKRYKITYIIMIINILIFLVEVLNSKSLISIDMHTLLKMGAKSNHLIEDGEYYRLITAGFLHGGIIHLFFNMSALNIIGKEVEEVYETKKYIFIYALSLLGGSIFSYFFSNSISVGASGAIFGLLGAMLAFGLINKRKIGKAYIKNIFETIVLNIIIGLTIPNIDNFAHMGGLIFGSIVSFLLLKKVRSKSKE